MPLYGHIPHLVSSSIFEHSWSIYIGIYSSGNTLEEHLWTDAVAVDTEGPPSVRSNLPLMPVLVQVSAQLAAIGQGVNLLTLDLAFPLNELIVRCVILVEVPHIH